MILKRFKSVLKIEIFLSYFKIFYVRINLFNSFCGKIFASKIQVIPYTVIA